MWDKVFKNRPSKVCRRQNKVKFFKGCLPQILLGPRLNTLSHIELGHLQDFLEKKNVNQ